MQLSQAKSIRFVAKSHRVGSQINLKSNFCWTNHQALVFFGSSLMFNPISVNISKKNSPFLNFCFKEAQLCHTKSQAPLRNVVTRQELRREKFCGASLLTLRAKAKKRLARDTRRVVDHLVVC